MYTLIIVLLIIVAILTCGIVLIQESKGGGLASGFSSSNQVLGVRKTTDFLEKATWTLAAVMVVLCIASAAFAGDYKKQQATVQPTAPAQQAAPQNQPLNIGENATPSQDNATPAKEEAAPAQEAPAQDTPAAPEK